MSSGMTTSVAIHQQLEIIDVRDDLRLPRDLMASSAARPGVGRRIPELRDGGALEHPIHGVTC